MLWVTVVTVGSNAAAAAVTAVAAAVAGASQQKKVSKQVINQAINLYSPMQLQANNKKSVAGCQNRQ